MNRWSRIVLALAVAAAAAWLATGALGFRVVDDRTLAHHTLLGFATLLALLMTQSWIAVFALVSERLVTKRMGSERNREHTGTGLAELARARRQAVGSALVAIAAAVAQFTVANALYPGRLLARPHLAAGIASAVVLVAALGLEARALARHGRAIAALEP